jgi:carbonic anhydrase
VKPEEITERDACLTAEYQWTDPDCTGKTCVCSDAQWNDYVDGACDAKCKCIAEGHTWGPQGVKGTCSAPPGTVTTDGTLKVLESSVSGPKMIAANASPKAAANKPTVWTLRKGLSREDCVSLEPLNNPGWYLRLTEQEVAVPSSQLPGGSNNPTESEESIELGGDLGESASVGAGRLMNGMFTVPKPHLAPGEKGVVDFLTTPEGHPNVRLAETNQAMTMTKVTTVVLSQNDASLEFLKQSTWCMRNPRAASLDTQATTTSLESEAKPGFFLMRKGASDLVGLGVGSEPLNGPSISWQVVDPKFEICPKNCNRSGVCGDATDMAGTCKCDRGFASKDCGIFDHWPTVNASYTNIRRGPTIKAIQALVADAGVPQDFDGEWSTKTDVGVRTYMQAKGLDPQTPFDGKGWELLVKDVKTGMGGEPGPEQKIVTAIQELLNTHFDYKIPLTGAYDDKTATSVSDFKARMQLVQRPTVVDKETWNKLVGNLPSTVSMWPVEASYQPIPDQQIFYLQNEHQEEAANCQLSGHYAWSFDVPGRQANVPQMTAAMARSIPAGGGSGLGTVAGTSQGLPSLSWKDKSGASQPGQKSLQFFYLNTYRGGYAACEKMKGFDNGAFGLTVEMWFKPATVSQKAMLFSSNDKKSEGFQIQYRGSALRIGISGESWVEAPVSFFEDTWHHVAGTFNGTTEGTGELKVFLDGSQVARKIVPESSIPFREGKDLLSPLIGADAANPQTPFWGSIDKVRISRKALAANELLLQASNAGSMNPATSFYVDVASVADDLPFTYEGIKGPGGWSLIDNNTKCSGDEQSPIDLPSPTGESGSYSALPASHLKYIEMRYHNTDVKSMFNPSTLGATVGFAVDAPADSPKGELILNDFHYAVRHATFHTPSEHTLASMPTEMEMQIMHESIADKSKAIVAILFKKGRNNTVLQPVLEALSKLSPPSGDQPLGSLDLLDVIPFDPGFVVYDGSLTTPPCNESVKWIVVDKPTEASAEQINIVKNIVGMNSRPLQNRNGRTVKRLGMGTSAMLAESFLKKLARLERSMV